MHRIAGSPIVAEFHALPLRPAGFIGQRNNVPCSHLGELPLLSATLGDDA
jgi:hypothetical protein